MLSRARFFDWLAEAHRPPLVMGILNVTPDSFSDGGRFATVDAAVAHAEQMIAEGADLIDIGGESTRPGSLPVAIDEQIARTVPVIQAIASRHDIVISIDTTRSAVAKAALEAGATLVNDVTAGRDDDAMLPLVAKQEAPIVLMHMQGTPRTMQENPVYRDVVGEVRDVLVERTDAAVRAGVPIEHVLLDPGIGFGKTLEHNLELLRRQRELVALGRPLLVGTSRKRFIGTITGESEPSQRLFGTAATVAWAVANGAAIVRVHDVGPMTRVVQMTRALVGGAGSEFLKV